ncbi:MAG: penicillin-binding transpeptidase domain-containing protein [Lachnospiraceae bacterium]|nr:penicillin-binding transpeptidase domain-containing protein [Lachnospiraceae bacterium]
MIKKGGYNRKKNSNKKRNFFLWVIGGAAGIAAIIATAGVYMAGFLNKRPVVPTPDELLVQYMAHIPKQEYEQMYAMIDSEASGSVSLEDFIQRNSAIYEGIEMQNMTVEVLEYNEEENVVTYNTSFDTAAGNISFENRVLFIKGDEAENGYKMVWNDSLIFPSLNAADKVRVSATQAVRGEIYDRNGKLLAGEGTASSVGIVPGKLEDREAALQEMAELLETTPESIEKKLSAKWVKDDYFVPIKTVPKIEEMERMTWKSEEEILQEGERQEKLLTIPGVMISDTQVRTYPLGEAAAHLIGYVQNVTAEDLEKHAGEGYTADSVIGRSGMESLFEEKLRGRGGCRIYITDGEGNEKEELACIPVQDGEDIRLTIDAELQISIYSQFKEDKSCSVSMNPYTGEVLALVSTPSYDNNCFVMGLSTEKWNALNEDENMPMYNRFRQVWCPGSTFKPVTAAVGLESGAVDPDEDYGTEGLSWQQDSSWGSYYVTTLQTYEPVILENALIYSDNIYFAKAAVMIGAEKMADS